MAMIDLNFPPEFTRYETWEAADPSFYEALAMGALPANHETGDWYNVTNVGGQILLNGCTPLQIFNDTCGAVVSVTDDRRVQLYQSGARVADIPAVEAFAYGPTSTWELWKAYYESYGFQTGRTGTWTVPGGVPVVDPPVVDPATGEVIVPPLIESADASGYLVYAIGAALLIALLRR